MSYFKWLEGTVSFSAFLTEENENKGDNLAPENLDEEIKKHYISHLYAYTSRIRMTYKTYFTSFRSGHHYSDAYHASGHHHEYEHHSGDFAFSLTLI